MISQRSDHSHDSTILKDLVKRIQDLSALPIQQTRQERWIRSNSVQRRNQSPRPPVYAALYLFDESFENGIIKPQVECENPDLQQVEVSLKHILVRQELIPDDIPVHPPEWIVPRKISGYRDWGLQPKYHGAVPYSGGSFYIDPVIHIPSDLDKMKIADLVYDEQTTLRQFDRFQDLIGQQMTVKLGGLGASVNLMQCWTNLRGVENTLLDMIADPEFLHHGIEIMAEGYRCWYTQAEKMNILDSGVREIFATDDLPVPGYRPDRVRLCDQMVFVEAQELTGVSPRMHEEFAIRYEKPLAEMFGLTSYGCCEDLTEKIEQVATIANLRQIGVTPFADVTKCAERIRERFVISWRPSPVMLTDPFDEENIRRSIRSGLEVLKANHCSFHIFLKDIHSCSGHPERLTRWTQIVNEEVTRLWGE
jgi:hypothetical protein